MYLGNKQVDMNTLFLINPDSGRKRDAAETEAMIHNIYQAAGKQVETLMIDFSRLDEMLEDALKRGIQNIFAVGGDGTVNAIGTRLRNREVNFGVIPKGSGNGYARNLGFSIKTKLAITQAIDAFAMKVDTATFNGIPFLNVAGVGLDAEVARIFSEGKRRGFRPYVKSSAEGLIAFEAKDYYLEVDGEARQYEGLMGIAIANGSQWGYNAKISPHASITDGYLDVIVVRKFPLIKIGMFVGKLFNGKVEKSKYVEVFRAKKVFIRRDSSGDAQVDGEPTEAGKEIYIEIQEKNLSVLLPNTLTDSKIRSL